MIRQYSKGVNAKATIGEVQALANSGSYAAVLAARFAITLSLIAVLEGAVAIALALR